MAQDNAFPVFPTKRAPASGPAPTSTSTPTPAHAPARQEQQAARPPRGQSRPREDRSHSRADDTRPPRNHPDHPHARNHPDHQPDYPPLRHQPANFNPSRTRPSTADPPRPPPHSRPQQPPHALQHSRSQDSARPAPQVRQNEQRQYARPPAHTFNAPYLSAARPSTSDSTRERPFLAPLDTHVAHDAHAMESAQLSSVTARHRPAIVPNPHAPYQGRVSQAAHLSNASDFAHAHPQQAWNGDFNKHESLGGVYDDYYQREAAPRHANREDEIEAAMPDFRRAVAHKRQPTVDEHLNNLHLNSPPLPPQPLPPQGGYHTASSRLNGAKPHPDLHHRTPIQDEANAFDFGFQGQQLTQSPEQNYDYPPPQHPAQAMYHQTQPLIHQQQPNHNYRQPPPPQHDYGYDQQPSMHSPPQPQQNYPYNDQSAMSGPPMHRQPRNDGFDVRSDHQGRPMRGQHHQQPHPDQLRSQSYDDPNSGGLPRPPPQQRALTSNDQPLYSEEPYGRQQPMQQGRPMHQNAPMGNGNMSGPGPMGQMSRGPPPGQGFSGGMPSGSMPDGQARRAPPMPRPMPPGSMPPVSMPSGPMPPVSMPSGPMQPGMMHPGQMNGGPRNQSRGPQSRRPVPGQNEYRPGPGMQAMPNDGRAHMQPYPSDERAPSAPASGNGFAPPPRQADYGYGPDPNMDNRAPRPRYAMDDRSPSAPPPSDRSFGAPLARERSTPQQQYGYDQSENLDALPSHPVPVRPGLNNGPPTQNQKPANDDSRSSGPVTRIEIESLRAKVDANPHDSKTAMVLVKKLVEASTVLASENGYLDAKATAKNSERYALEAHKRVKKLVAINYPDAMFYLADCYGSGDLGLESDPKQAFALYQSAAKFGHGAAAYRTAICCELGAEEGGGTKRDYLKAVQWYQRAAQLQDVAAMYKMGMILLRGLLSQPRNVGQSVVYLKRAAEHADADNPHAIHELARLHEAGNPDPAVSAAVKPDEKYAQRMYMQAAKMGYKQSQFRLGQAFEYGSLGLPVDSRNSIAWYTKAAAQGEHNSELALSGWYLTGAEGILNQSDTEAYLWARKAALSEPPLAKAMYALGYYIENGIGCTTSLEEAKKWYTRAASYKFPKAVERLEEIRRGKAGRPPPTQGRLTRSNQKRDEAECVVM